MKDLTQEDKKKGPSLYLRFLRFVEKVTKKKFLIRLTWFVVIAFIIFTIFFPAQAGDLIGTWYHNLTSSFSNATK